MQSDLVTNYRLKKENTLVINNPLVKPKENLIIQPYSEIVFITVGNLVESKGFLRILDMLSKVEFDFKYYIVGEGILRSDIEESIKEWGLVGRAFLTGYLDDVSSYYRKSHIYLHGAYYEGFPNVLLEACSFGLPIVSFKTPGTSEIIRNGYNGFTVNDEHSFLEKLTDGSLVHLDKKHIQDDIYDRYGLDKIIVQYENILDRYRRSK